MCSDFTSGRRPTSCASDGRYKHSPVVSSTMNAPACTQWTARSVRPKRGRRPSVTVRTPNPCVLVVAMLLPEAERLLCHELHTGEPLDALVAVHLRNDDASG